jgi:transporter family-2 protein
MKEINLLLFLLAIVVGFSLASQAGVNAQLRTALSSPIQAAFLSFLLGTVVLGIIVLVQGGPWFAHDKALNLPWWAWLGGVLGAFNIAVSIYLAPKLGALALAISLVCGQVIAALFYDQHGWLGYPKLEITPSRIIGALLVVLGVIMVSKK